MFEPTGEAMPNPVRGVYHRDRDHKGAFLSVHQHNFPKLEFARALGGAKHVKEDAESLTVKGYGLRL